MEDQSKRVRNIFLAFDDDKDLAILSETREQKFVICIVIADTGDIGWKESQAIIDCLENLRVGKVMDIPNFKALCSTLAEKYDKVRGPFIQHDVYAAVVKTSRGRFSAKTVDTLTTSQLDLKAEDNNILFRSYTRKDTSFLVVLRVTEKNMVLNYIDCKLFLGVLSLLEAGNDISEDLFLTTMAKRKSQGIGLDISQRTIKEHVCTYAVLSGPGRKDRSKTESSSSSITSTVTEISTVTEDDSRNESPYPGIIYRRALKKSGQAQVYDAMRQGKRVAVKVFLEGDDQVDTYKTELRMLLQMSQHPNVVRVIDFFETPKPALVMEFVEGQDLMDYLEQNGGFSQRDGLKLCLGIANGLNHLHKYGIIHRDMKTANILRRSDGAPIIIDLGLGSILKQKKFDPPGHTGALNRRGETSINDLCAAMSSTHIAAQTVGIKGTLFWMAPEMIVSQSWSDRTDVYAFAIIMWEIFSGKTPFLSEINDDAGLSPMAIMVGIMVGKRPSLQEIAHIEPWLKVVIQDCWHNEPSKRPRMSKILERLQRSDPESLFRAADVDKSGHISFAEFVNFLEKYIPGKVSEEGMYPLFKSHSVNGKMTMSGFLNMWAKVS